MKSIIHLSLSIAFSLLFMNCNHSAVCDLQTLNLKGNVKTVEIVTQTPIPISEWLYANRVFGDFETYWSPVRSYSFIGNSILKFNKRGNITKNIVFNNDGKQIAKGKPNQHPSPLYKHFAIDVNELYSDVTSKKDNRNRVIEELYTEKGIDRYKRTISYDKDGNIEMVTCNYLLAAFSAFDTTFESIDSLKFNYIEYDSHGNWTRALIKSNGYLKRNDYTMEVLRQITYYGGSIHEPLINKLNDLNTREEKNYKTSNITYKHIKLSGDDLNIEVPINFEIFEQPVSGTNYYQSTATNTDGFFSFNVLISYQSYDLIKDFDSYTDYEFEESMRSTLESNGIQILVWCGSKIVTINGYKGVWCSYYHYPIGGMGGAPVKVEIYQFQDPITGKLTALTFGYDAAHAYEYCPQIEYMKSSIILSKK